MQEPRVIARRPLWRRLVKWLFVGIAGVVVVGAVALTIAYFRSTNECDASAGAPAHPMKAIVYCEYGTADVLKLTDVEKPAPADDQVLVKVRAASVNPLDWHFMRGTPYVMRLQSGLRKPKSIRLGVDFAGTVEAVGKGVTRLKAGDDVFGTRTGAFAEYVAVREDRVVQKPAALTFDEAASIPVAAVTALQGLRDEGKLQPGQSVLINGASGGVGTFAVQIAKTLGARVTGVCSTRNLDMVRALGADQVIDYTKDDFTKSPERFDVILDNVGNRPLLECRRVLKPDGKYVLIGGGGPDAGSWIGPLAGPIKAIVITPFVRQQMSMLLANVNKDDLTVLAGLMESGKVKPVIDRRYPLSETAEAIRYIEQGHARGKVIIAMDEAKPLNADVLRDFAAKYTAAWCSQNAASVADFFSEGGSLKINASAPSVGRKAITEAAQGFMTAFPDLVVAMDAVEIKGDHAVYRWTLTGTNTGPGGTGKAVRISGYEEWSIGADGLIAESKGHFDENDYQRQLRAADAKRR